MVKILVVCPYFPPENTIAAIRIGKFAQYWSGAGHDVTILCREPVTGGLPGPEDPRIRIIAVPDPLGGIGQRAKVAASSARPGMWSRTLALVKQTARALAWPDLYVLWAVRARVSARQAIPDADVVVTSAGPFSALLLGWSLATRLRTPLVVDYRDLLAFGPYYDHNRLRTALDQWIERRAVRTAALIAAVSIPMADDIHEHFERPAMVVTNGFDPADFSGLGYSPASPELRIVYCGQIYVGRRDPTALFKAVAIARGERPDLPIHVDFYGRALCSVLTLAEEFGVADHVTYHGEVSHQESLVIQAQADLLLMLLWNDPRERAVLSGKIFEYIGARRPMVMLGLEDGAAANLIRENRLGIVSNDPSILAEYLIGAAVSKAQSGRVEAPPETMLTQFTRETQSAAFLDAILKLL